MSDPMSYEDVEAVSSARGFEAEDGGWVAAARYALAHNSFVMVEGSILDTFSASAMIQVYDRLSERNQAKLAAMSMVQAHTVVFQILEKVERA